MFLPLGLCTAPRVFNLFAEALHWVFETLYEWNCTHYSNDFLFVFPPGTNISHESVQFNFVLSKFGLSKAVEKDLNGCVVVHLGFEFDSINTQFRLPPAKKQQATDAVNSLLSSRSVRPSNLESTLGVHHTVAKSFLSASLFFVISFRRSLLCRDRNRSSAKICLSPKAQDDLSPQMVASIPRFLVLHFIDPPLSQPL
jgi:hypothetical protein